MSVLIETSAGDIVIDLLTEYVPRLCENFLKLCKVKYYNFSPVHSIQKNFSFQTGDPLGPLSAESDGGTSIYGLVSGDPRLNAFPALFHPKLKHVERGTVSMATVPAGADPDQRLAASQFVITLGEATDYLDGRTAIFGKVVEGFDVLEKINNAITDENGHPLVDIRIKHTVVLDDPYPDPDGLREPTSSPVPNKAQLATVRIADEAALREDDGLDEDKLEQRRRAREARAQALTLEMMGDLPFAEVRPPENVLFVCKLNPVTADEDLELIFGRFGTILSCEVIRDHKTGDSLQYAFIEYDDKAGCEAAYSKMQDVLIDDRRIHVDFSQSVSKLSDVWRSDANRRRREHAGSGRSDGGGWGGVRELEKRTHYRDGRRPQEDRRDGRYRLVHGPDQSRKRHRSRSQSPFSRQTDGGKNSRRSPDHHRGDHSRGNGRQLGTVRRSGQGKDGDRYRDRGQNQNQDQNQHQSQSQAHSPDRDCDRDHRRDGAGGRGRGRGRGDWGGDGRHINERKDREMDLDRKPAYDSRRRHEQDR